MIDLHCHVIPDLDDGPATIEDSVALCRAARVAGTNTIIATPHVNWSYPAVDVASIDAGVDAVNAALREASIDLEVKAGAEIALSRIGDMSDAEISLLRLGEGPYSLIECPHQGGAAAAVEQMLRQFAGSGHSILLAHPERCPVFQSSPRLLPALTAIGMLACITARSLTGDFGSRARAYAWELLAAGQVHAIASDAHDVHGRPPDLACVLDRAGLTDTQIEYFAFSSPEAIISGGLIRRPPSVTERPASGFSLRRRLRRTR
ncbi:MAG TPA: CpsB/CapC family capsule biosynthesis tyrosine phosphatase [Solirubrobacteraceae bacterium]|nr:CpsB/CapC family capsule biosynthesis tyrosine phosphatase [Solirubrobacteraceae bacterium]